MATTQSKSFKGGAIAADTGLYDTVLPINTDGDGRITNNGNLLTVTGNNAWAEGERTKATAGRAHAEGYGTEASAADSHAEGSNTQAGGAESHAEGSNTIASGQGSHAEGGATHATGQYSHSEGYNTQATRLTSHAEGRDTVASHVCSHAEGYSTKASGESSHSEGENTEASGQGSHAEGAACVASGDYSHASGTGTRATDRGSTAVGRFNKDGTALFVVGDGVNPDEEHRDDAFKVDRFGRSYVKNEAGNLVKVRGAGIAIFTVSRSGGTYTYPNADDVIDAISNYDEVVLKVVTAFVGTFNYAYENSLIANEYRWIREDGSHVITLTGTGSPLVWTWTEGDSKLKQDVLTLDSDIGKISESIAPSYSSLTFPVKYGKPCMYDRRLYTCSVLNGIPASEEWTPEHWTLAEATNLNGWVSIPFSDCFVATSYVVDQHNRVFLNPSLNMVAIAFIQKLSLNGEWVEIYTRKADSIIGFPVGDAFEFNVASQGTSPSCVLRLRTMLHQSNPGGIAGRLGIRSSVTEWYNNIVYYPINVTIL